MIKVASLFSQIFSTINTAVNFNNLMANPFDESYLRQQLVNPKTICQYNPFSLNTQRSSLPHVKLQKYRRRRALNTWYNLPKVRCRLMTEAEMTQITLDHWRREYPKEFKKLSWDKALRQARACASLTQMEMRTLKLTHPGMTDYEAWTESRHLFCMKPPQTHDDETMYDLEMDEDEETEH